MGLCSYLLIGFWYEKPSAAAAGKKAFLVNRIGDFGFALGVFLIWTTYGTLDFHDTAGAAGVLGQLRLSGAQPIVGGAVGTAICLLLMLGACGKSAQFPTARVVARRDGRPFAGKCAHSRPPRW